MSDQGEADKIDQPLEATVDNLDAILPDPVHSKPPKLALQHGARFDEEFGSGAWNSFHIER